jgi:hypothetical protein
MKAIELNPELAHAHYNLGNLLRELKRTSESENEFAIAYNPFEKAGN